MNALAHFTVFILNVLLAILSRTQCKKSIIKKTKYKKNKPAKFCRPYHEDHFSAIESSILSFKVFKILAENCKKKKKKKEGHFSPFKGNNSYKELSDNFHTLQTLVGLIIWIILEIKRIWINFWSYMKKHNWLTPMF